MKALITGITGFVGGHLAEYLLAEGDEVLGCSRSGVWAAPIAPGAQQKISLLGWDLSRPDGMRADTERRIAEFGPDCVYHLAALSVPEDCGQTCPTPQARASNVESTSRILELAARLRPRPRVLFVSTSHIYAPVTLERPTVAEDSPLAPTQGYGMTKLEAEWTVAHAVASAGIDAVVARAFQHCGPRQSPRMMLSQWARQFARGAKTPVEVYNCDTYIDLTDVRDVVRAYRLLIERGERGAIYNVGSGVRRRTGDILQQLRDMADPGRPIVELRPGIKQDPIADISRLAGQTGWQPRIPLEQTIRDTLAYWHVALSIHRTTDAGARLL